MIKILFYILYLPFIYTYPSIIKGVPFPSHASVPRLLQTPYKSAKAAPTNTNIAPKAFNFADAEFPAVLVPLVPAALSDSCAIELVDGPFGFCSYVSDVAGDVGIGERELMIILFGGGGALVFSLFARSLLPIMAPLRKWCGCNPGWEVVVFLTGAGLFSLGFLGIEGE